MKTSPQDDSCSCPDFTLSRRRLLGATAATTGVLAAGQMFGDAFRQVAYGAEQGNNVVVILSMRGGADGLSMVVPATAADQAVLRSARPNIMIPAGSLVAGDSRFGLHPAFKPLQDMWNVSKNFGAVHSVGLPAPNRSHFASIMEVEDSTLGGSVRTGWVNRTVGLSSTPSPMSSVQMGTTLMPTSLIGDAPSLAVSQVSDLQVAPFDPGRASARRQSIQQVWSDDAAVAGRAVRSALKNIDRVSGLATAASKADANNPVHPSAFPEGALRSVLANTSALIRADIGARFVTVDYGNWDMHQNLGAPDSGWMFNQIDHLAKSLKAFFEDLGAAASRVTVVTLSEFGRRVAQNGSYGLDHGWGNAMLLLGAGVDGGKVHGEWAGLNNLADGDVTMQTSFQTVLWDVVSSRFADLSGARRSLFPSAESQAVKVMQ